MSDIDDALNEVTKVFNIFRGAEKVKSALENIKGFETVEKELTGRIAKLKTEETRLQERKDELLNEAVKKRDQAAEILLNAQAKAIEIDKEATAKAKSVIETATEKKEQLERLLTAANAKLSEVTQAAEDKALELSDLEGKIKNTKAEMRKLAGD